jgi:hypothetical protein
VLVDFRQPEVTRERLGGPFHEIVSVMRAPARAAAATPPASAPPEAALAAFTRAVVRVQAWLARTPPDEVADRLPADLVGDRERFVARLAALRGAYAPDGAATPDGLAATFRVLRGGSPWPVTLEVKPNDVAEPAFVIAARAALGPRPSPP